MPVEYKLVVGRLYLLLPCAHSSPALLLWPQYNILNWKLKIGPFEQFYIIQ